MTPMITMGHFVYPGWPADEGGFLQAGAVMALRARPCAAARVGCAGPAPP